MFLQRQHQEPQQPKCLLQSCKVLVQWHTRLLRNRLLGNVVCHQHYPLPGNRQCRYSHTHNFVHYLREKNASLMRPQNYENACGVCLLYGVLSLTAVPREPQTASPCQTAAQASEMDELIQIWYNKSFISNSYMPSWSAGMLIAIHVSWGLGTEQCSLSRGHTNLGRQKPISAQSPVCEKFKAFPGWMLKPC